MGLFHSVKLEQANVIFNLFLRFFHPEGFWQNKEGVQVQYK